MTKSQKIFDFEKMCDAFEEFGTKLISVEGKEFDAYARLLGKSVHTDSNGCKYFLVKGVKVKRL